MRKVVFDTYECEICGTHYETAEQATQCEAVGRPDSHFAEGAKVRFRPQAGPDALKDEQFVVEKALVTLGNPVWVEDDSGGEDGPSHLISYVLQNHLGQVAFIPEHQLMPAQ